MRRAVIDLSWTSSSLLVTEEKNGQLISIYKDYIPFNTMKHTSKEGSMKEKGLLRLEEDIRTLMKRADALSVSRTDIISTTLLRKVQDPGTVELELEDALGMKVTPVSGYEEAWALWYANERYSCLEKAVLINIGGSSTELCDYSHPDMSGMMSLPFGAAELKNMFVTLSLPTRDELRKMKEYVTGFIRQHGEHSYENAVLSGRNLNAIWKIYQDRYDIAPGDECLMQRGKLKKLIDLLMDEKKGEKLIIDNCPEKIHLIIPTAVTLKAILSEWHINNMTVSPLGVKEGWLKNEIRKEREEGSK